MVLAALAACSMRRTDAVAARRLVKDAPVQHRDKLHFAANNNTATGVAQGASGG